MKRARGNEVHFQEGIYQTEKRGNCGKNPAIRSICSQSMIGKLQTKLILNTITQVSLAIINHLSAKC